MKRLGYIIGLLLIIIAISAISFKVGSNKMIAMVNNEVDTMFQFIDNNESELILEQDIEHLPQQMQNYLKYCKVIGKQNVQSIQLEQQAEIKLNQNDEKWSYHETKQYFNAVEPGFIWYAKLPVAFLNFLVRDKLLNGTGEMLVTIGGAITLGKENGTNMDKAGVGRYMGECGWFPQCFVNNYYTWETLDSNKVKATLTFGKFKQDGIFTFNEHNQIVKFECMRFCSWTNQDELYINYFKDYTEMDGVIIPKHGVAAYLINGEVVEYWRGDLTEIKYNQPIKNIE